MPRDASALIFDALKHAQAVRNIVRSTSLTGYLQDPTIQAASRYHLVVVGEALNTLRQIDPARASQISDLRKIIDLRNFLVHVYQAVDDEKLWMTLQQNLETLIRELTALEGSSAP